MKVFKYLLLAVILPVMADAAQQQKLSKKGQLTTASNLYQLPENRSPVLTELAADEPLDIAKRQRSWYQVFTQEQQQGWVKMLNVRFVGVMKRQGELGVKNVFDSVFTKQLAPTASTGVRGFDEEDLHGAQADLAQLILLNSYKLTPEDANQFAASADIKPNLAINVETKQE